MPASDLASRRAATTVRASWPPGAPGRVLALLVLLGLALRILAAIGSWPTMPTLEDGYQVFAKTSPFTDPQHPAGYSLIIAAFGAVTHRLAVFTTLQHLLGVASALLLGAATRRMTGSAWAGLLPAAMILLGADQIFLEHVVMSESWEVLASSSALYAAVRALDDPHPWWRWPLLTGVVLGLAVMIRSAALPLIAVIVVALFLHRPGARGERDARPRWRAPLAVTATAASVLLAFALANAHFGPRFELAPSPGWYLYGQAAQFADCRQFTPPPGTQPLCENRPTPQRPGYYFYMFDPHAPAVLQFGAIGRDDGLVGAFARRAILAQLGDFLHNVWIYLRAYWVPGSFPGHLRSDGTPLDPQVDFTFTNPFFAPGIRQDLEAFFAPFAVHQRHGVLRALHDWQRVVRFGATALFLTTILTVIGLLIGTRRSRIAVLLFGVGGLSLILAPGIVGNYTGRYTVPMAGPLMAASAVTLLESWRLTRRRIRRRDGAEDPAV